MRLVIVGAVALGPKVACRVRRLLPDAEVTLVDQDRFISYGGCGIPYYLADEVPDETQLMSTSFHAVRDPRFFREAKGVAVLPRTRAVALDRARRRVAVEDLESGARRELPYDRLVLATGSVGSVPPVPGRDLGNVFVVHNLQNALDLKRALITEEIRHAVVVGGGALGLEVEGQFLKLGAVVDLDAVHGAAALAQGAGVALVGAALVLDEVEETHAARLVHELAALEVDALEDFVQGRAPGLGYGGAAFVTLRHPGHLSPSAGSDTGAR